MGNKLITVKKISSKMWVLFIWYVMFIKIGRKANSKLNDDQLSHFAMLSTLFSKLAFITLLTHNAIYYFELDCGEKCWSNIGFVVIPLMWLFYFVFLDVGSNTWKIVEKRINTLTPNLRNGLFY